MLEVIKNLKSWNDADLQDFDYDKTKIFCAGKSAVGLTGNDIICIAERDGILNPPFGYHEFNGNELEAKGLKEEQKKILIRIMVFTSKFHYYARNNPRWYLYHRSVSLYGIRSS